MKPFPQAKSSSRAIQFSAAALSALTCPPADVTCKSENTYAERQRYHFLSSSSFRGVWQFLFPCGNGQHSGTSSGNAGPLTYCIKPQIETSKSNYRKSRTTAALNWNVISQRMGWETGWLINLNQTETKLWEIRQFRTWVKGTCNYCTDSQELISRKKLFLSARCSECSLVLTVKDLPPP